MQRRSFEVKQTHPPSIFQELWGGGQPLYGFPNLMGWGF